MLNTQCSPSAVRILFLDHTAALSGAELSMLNLVQRLDTAQFVPTVLLFADGPLAAALGEVGVTVKILPLTEAVRGAGRGSLGVGSLAKLGAALSSAAFVLRLARHIRAAKPEIVHCNSLKSDILGGFAARLAGAKIIWHIHDRIETDYLSASVVKVLRRLARVIPHYVIANSQATLETLKLPKGKRFAVVYPSVPAAAAVAARLQVTGDRLQGDASRITDHGSKVYPGAPGINTDQKLGVRGEELEGNAGVPPASSIKSGALPQALISPGAPGLVIEKDAPHVVSSCLGGEQNSVASVPSVASSSVVVLVGRISPWKGQDVFIRAAAIVLKTFPACRFQIVGSALFGEDALEGELRQLAVSLGVGDRVEFLGFRKDVPEIIAASTLLVHASTVPEPFGQVIVQAMAESKPVVATRGGGVLEIVDDGKTGLLVPMKDAEAMAKAIGEILADPAKAQKMGEAGRERFLEKLTIERTVEEVEAVYVSMTTDH